MALTVTEVCQRLVSLNEDDPAETDLPADWIYMAGMSITGCFFRWVRRNKGE